MSTARTHARGKQIINHQRENRGGTVRTSFNAPEDAVFLEASRTLARELGGEDEAEGPVAVAEFSPGIVGGLGPEEDVVVD